jgi:hypothetical protein
LAWGDAGETVRVELDSPRPLTAAERMVLDLLLSAEFAGVGVLREQARSVVVTGGCDCGCPTVDLRVGGDVRAVAGLGSGLVLAQGVVSVAGQDAAEEIILFLRDGRLSCLEYVWLEEPPRQWPARERISVVIAGQPG